MIIKKPWDSSSKCDFGPAMTLAKLKYCIPNLESKSIKDVCELFRWALAFYDFFPAFKETEGYKLMQSANKTLDQLQAFLKDNLLVMIKTLNREIQLLQQSADDSIYRKKDE